jgi:DNA-3-methyladenine glycosylase II
MQFESLTDPAVWSKGVKHLRKKDMIISGVIQRLGPYGKFETYSDSYGALVESIVFQQLAGKAAQSILGRFKKLYRGKLPKPSRFLKTEERIVRGTGISPQKYSYIKDLCLRLENGLLELEALQHMDNEEVIKALDDVRGIGRWTAEMFLIFSLARTDVLPVDDLGIRKAVRKAYGLKRLPERKDFEKLAKKWHPYESIAILYLWRSHDG